MLVNCVAYEKGRRSCDLPMSAVRDWLDTHAGFVWVALRDPDDAELGAAKAAFQLPDEAIEEARRVSQRPIIAEYDDDILFAVLKLVEYSGNALNVGELDVFVGPRFVLSLRTNSDRNLLGVRARLEHEPELLELGPGIVFYALLENVIDRFFPVIDEMDEEFDRIEPLIFGRGKQREALERLYGLKQRVTEMRHAVAPLYDAASKLHGGRVPRVVAGMNDYFRDVYEYMYRAMRALEGLRDSIGTAMTVNLSMVTMDQTDISKRLAAWAAIFGAVTALAGIWGMNFEFMPELNEPWGYPAALALMVGTAGVLAWRFRRSGWL
ncbi:MAG: magnesium and cobalt transport protein CorA [Proteobacteria bacterium]|nr:magnesium and cobalt transport protein CorA [Burkholderiales bacterium]